MTWDWNALARQLARAVIAAQAREDVVRALIRLALVDVVAALPPMFHGPNPCPGYATGGVVRSRTVLVGCAEAWTTPAVKRMKAGRAEGGEGGYPDAGVGLGS